MLMVASFLANTILNFVLGLAVAGLLGSAEYGRYSVAATIAAIAALAAFEWLRVSTTRSYSRDAHDERPAILASLKLGYLGGSAAILAATAVALALGADFGLGGALVAAAAMASLATGYFDFAGARLRARFEDRAYARLILAKNAIALATMLAAAALFRSASLVLAMLALSSLASILLARGEARDRATKLRDGSLSSLLGFAGYGMPVLLASVVYQGIALINRGEVATHDGFAAAGHLSLPTDLTIRLMLSLAGALDIFLFQLAVRRLEKEGETGAQHQVARNITIITAVMALFLVGYLAALPAFTALVAPQAFRSDFESLAFILAPGVALFCTGQFAFGPIFQLRNDTAAMLISALAALAANVLALRLAPVQTLSDYAAVHSASLAFGCLVMAAQAARWRAFWPPLRDFAIIGLAASLAALATWPLRQMQPAGLALAAIFLCGSAVYGSVLLAFDLAGVRRLTWAFFSDMRSGAGLAVALARLRTQ